LKIMVKRCHRPMGVPFRAYPRGGILGTRTWRDGVGPFHSKGAASKPPSRVPR
jgi:hypothetical protein